MPSDVKKPPATESDAALTRGPTSLPDADPLPEPPSARLLVRLFLIPFIIVAVAVGIMFLIGRLAGTTPSFEDAVARLKNPGGGRTAEVLIGPGSKQRYLDAKTLVDKMKQGMTEPQRIALTSDLIDILANHTQPGEGEVRHFLLLALGRVWQTDPAQPPMNSPEAVESRKKAIEALIRESDAPEVSTRKATVLAGVYLAGQEEARALLPVLIGKLGEGKEDPDVRIAAATALGPLARPDDREVLDALHAAMRQADERNAELVWSSALSLAQLGQKDVADTILMLLDRKELSRLRYYDRETDPQNPQMRTLSDQEQQRILINTMIGVQRYDVPAVQQRLRELAESDPSPRVRAAAREVLAAQPAPEP